MTSFGQTTLSIVNGLTLNTTVNLGRSDGSTYEFLEFNGSQTLGGNGTVVFGGNSGNSMLLLNGTQTLTISGRGSLSRISCSASVSRTMYFFCMAQPSLVGARMTKIAQQRYPKLQV
jgi:hypothetical protein